MTLHDNTYAAFMLDYASGVLSPAERLAADLHCYLSRSGGRNGRMVDAVGGALLEQAEPERSASLDAIKLGAADRQKANLSPLGPFLKRDLLALKWSRNFFGIKTLPAGVPMASLLRLDPGERAPGHGHGRRDVTVVLRGSYADEFGVYDLGDIAFSERGMKHEPCAVGDEPCVCLLATEPGRPIRGFFGQFGLVAR